MPFREMAYVEFGNPATFSLHACFTPGAGRIHFRLLGEEGEIRIAHVGGNVRPDL